MFDFHRRRGSFVGLTWSWRGPLYEPGSLTRRLRREVKGDFTVQVQEMRWSKLRQDEAHLLKLRHRHRALIREVVLWGGGRPLVYARSILPATTLTGRFRHLRWLGARPLGHLLFTTPAAQRLSMCLIHVQSPDPLYVAARRHAMNNVGRYHGRQSLFLLNGKPLLVTEFFLAMVHA
jgi:chorismate--pyruvate lyase